MATFPPFFTSPSPCCRAQLRDLLHGPTHPQSSRTVTCSWSPPCQPQRFHPSCFPPYFPTTTTTTCTRNHCASQLSFPSRSVAARQRARGPLLAPALPTPSKSTPTLYGCSLWPCTPIYVTQVSISQPVTPEVSTLMCDPKSIYSPMCVTP